MNNSLRPCVSIITPFRDANIYIESFVQMVKSQTFDNWECLMINDCSSDRGQALAERLTKGDSRFHILSVSNADKRLCPFGPAIARNYGIISACGYYLAFCDIDDLWNCEKLTRQILFAQHNDLELVVSGYVRFRDGYHPKALSIRIPPSNLNYKSLLGGNPIPMLTALVKRDIVDFLMPPSKHEDFFFWLNLFSSKPGLKYGCIECLLAYYRIHASNLSSSKYLMPFWSLSVFRSHGLHGFNLFFAFIRWSIYQVTVLSIDCYTRFVLYLEPVYINPVAKPQESVKSLGYILGCKIRRFFALA